MIDINKPQIQKVLLFDSIHNANCYFTFRPPTAEEIVSYKSKIMRLRGRKVTQDSKVKLRYGLLVMEGFEEGYLGNEGKPLSTDPSSPNYDENWKQHIRKACPHMVMLLCEYVFDSSAVEPEEQEDKQDFLESKSDSGSSEQ